MHNHFDHSLMSIISLFLPLFIILIGVLVKKPFRLSTKFKFQAITLLVLGVFASFHIVPVHAVEDSLDSSHTAQEHTCCMPQVQALGILEVDIVSILVCETITIYYPQQHAFFLFPLFLNKSPPLHFA
jgi:uncharacterized membrane protein YiaA